MGAAGFFVQRGRGIFCKAADIFFLFVYVVFYEPNRVIATACGAMREAIQKKQRGLHNGAQSMDCHAVLDGSQ